MTNFKRVKPSKSCSFVMYGLVTASLVNEIEANVTIDVQKYPAKPDCLRWYVYREPLEIIVDRSVIINNGMRIRSENESSNIYIRGLCPKVKSHIEINIICDNVRQTIMSLVLVRRVLILAELCK